MSAEEYRRKAEYFLTLAKALSRSEDKAALLDIATSWMERADEADKRQRVVRQPKKEREGEHS
jgi:hypothetical protein